MVCGALLSSCERPALQPGSPAYEEATGAFYTGVAAIQVGEDDRAERALSRVIELAPREPAAAANLAILAFQQRRLEDAAQWIDRARSQAPDDERVLLIAVLVQRALGRLDAAIGHVRRAVDVAPDDLRAQFLLTQLLEQRADAGDADESRRILDTLLESDGAGAFLLVVSARHAVLHEDMAAAGRALDRLETLAAAWPESDRVQLDRVRAVSASPADAGAELILLAASLERLPAFARERDALAISDRQPDLVLTRFISLPTPSPRPPEPDLALQWTARAIGAPSGAWRDVRPVWLDGEAPARIGLLEPGAFWLAGDTGSAQRIAVPPSGGQQSEEVALATLDFDRDFRTDLALVGEGGLRLLRQDSDGRFGEVGRAAIPAGVRARPFTGAWAADTDMDGDLDLLLAESGAPPLVLRNQGDGSFAEQEPFDDVAGARDFLWADLDDDGDPDAVFLDDGGRVHVFGNPRRDQLQFVRRDVPAVLAPAHAIALGDLDADGSFELLVLRADGAVVQARLTPEGWQVREAASWPEFTADPSGARLLVADLDNNGALDVAASSAGRTQLWFGDSVYALVPQQNLPVALTAAADLTGGGRVTLLGIDSAGQPVRLAGSPTRDYFALSLSPRSTNQPGDGRINTFGIGGEAEVRAGLLYQKQSITSPLVHFGIGENTGVTVARIIWPNGTAQAEFDILASQGRPIVAEQRLKGSCPWLFAFDGEAMQFVTDVAWRTALGLRINTYGATSVIHSEDWVRIRGDQLSPRAGFYELSITGELWESHFFDQVALMVVDHPAGTEVFVDERFALPPPELKLHVTTPLSPVAGVRDSHGVDVTALVESLDERYVDTFELGELQGVTRNEHYVEIDLGADVPVDSALMLVAQGWVYPTDGSINYALGQGSHSPPRGILVEVADGHGGWTVLHPDLGMPSGKTKTVLIDLTGALRGGVPRRVRLRTNMEIYWDRIAWTRALPDTGLRTERLPPQRAELRYRGFSKTRQAGRKAPELPSYAVAGTAQQWRNLEGYHTRFGDVLPLLGERDDRYVIMQAGDELLLRFAALPGPPAGQVRDYVLISDAWIKDGDFNNGFSGTLLPLPYHGLSDYSRAPARLEDDPAYQRHPGDWREYHTRWVSPDRFHHALSRR